MTFGKLAAVAFLFFFAGIVPELVTGSTPLLTFLNVGHVIILILGYCIPVVLLRDLATRYKLGIIGILLLGLAFGIYNEGLGAKTLIRDENLPIDSYDHYGFFGGVSFPWTFAIAIWHAVASVLIPIFLTNYLFPKSASEPYLGKKISVLLAVILMLFVSYSFFYDHESIGGGNELQWMILVGLIAIFVLAARFCPTRNPIEKKPLYGSFFVGLSLFVTYFIFLAMVVAGRKMPLPIFFIIFAALFYLYSYVMSNKYDGNKNIILFGLGVYVQNTLIGLLVNVFLGNIIQVVMLAIVCIGIIIFSRRIYKSTTA